MTDTPPAPEAGPLSGFENNLLKSLRGPDLALLAPFLERQSYKSGELVYEPGSAVEYVYFPCGPSLMSFRVCNDDGRDTETVLIGREGAVGGIVSRGHLPAYCRLTIKYGGPFLRLSVDRLEAAKNKSLILRYLFARYADCLLAQLFQSISCNAIHSIEQRAAKWIVAAMDRTGDHRVPLTHEELAAMLGVGRSYTSRVLQSFRSQGILETRRGAFLVQNRAALKARSCNCNDAVKSHFDVVLRGVYPEEDGVPSR